LSAKRPLSAGPALTEGDDAFHAVVFGNTMDMESDDLVMTKFEATVVGGAATLAAGATLAASLLF